MQVSYRHLELVIGREGSEAAVWSTNQLRPWASSPRARRAALHALDLLQTVNMYVNNLNFVSV
jgi:hypothetical protein